ncbi:hypothetical protein M5D96_007426, partial [Drosophila gunungcola]
YIILLSITWKSCLPNVKKNRTYRSRCPRGNEINSPIRESLWSILSPNESYRRKINASYACVFSRKLFKLYL